MNTFFYPGAKGEIYDCRKITKYLATDTFKWGDFSD